MSKEQNKSWVERFDEEFLNPPAISGKITNSDECCNCGEDLSLELYDAFSEGYKMAIGDSKSFISNELSAFAKEIIEVISKEEEGWYNEGEGLDVELSAREMKDNIRQSQMEIIKKYKIKI